MIMGKRISERKLRLMGLVVKKDGVDYHEPLMIGRMLLFNLTSVVFLYPSMLIALREVEQDGGQLLMPWLITSLVSVVLSAVIFYATWERKDIFIGQVLSSGASLSSADILRCSIEYYQKLNGPIKAWLVLSSLILAVVSYLSYGVDAGIGGGEWDRFIKAAISFHALVMVIQMSILYLTSTRVAGTTDIELLTVGDVSGLFLGGQEYDAKANEK
jgi:hypothetical protein